MTGYPVTLGARLTLAATEPARTVTVVGVARPRRPVSQQTAIFLTDAEATRLAAHPGRVDAIGVLAVPGFEAGRLLAAADGFHVMGRSVCRLAAGSARASRWFRAVCSLLASSSAHCASIRRAAWSARACSSSSRVARPSSAGDRFGSLGLRSAWRECLRLA